MTFYLRRRQQSYKYHDDNKLDWIYMRQCNKFVRKFEGTSEIEPKTLCKCGNKRIDHAGDVEVIENSNHDWNPEQDTIVLPTNTYGDIEFVGYGTGGMFVRMDVNTPMDQVDRLLFEYFHIDQPKMLISITGGAKGFHIDRKMKESFRRGLTKVIKSCGAWITTGGTNSGVMKDVGSIIRDYTLLGVSTEPAVALGIASWSIIQNRDDLVCDNEERDVYCAVQYRIERYFKKKECCLDPHHTHYLLIDNGTKHQYGVEIAFRAKLEKYLKEKYTLPVVQIVVDGGFNTLETIKTTLMEEIPVIVMKGSGRVADVVAYAYEKSNNEENNLGQENEDLIKEMFGKFDKDPDTCLKVLKKCLEYRQLITVSDNLSESSEEDFDVCILQALMKSNETVNIEDQLRLALELNRADIASSIIFVEKNFIEMSTLQEFMFSAITDGKCEFVELLMENGVSLKKFLNVECHERLYGLQYIAKNKQLRDILKQTKIANGTESHKVSISDVRCVLKSLIGIGILKKRDVPKDKRIPFLSLFIWSVFTGHFDLAHVFLNNGKNPIATALVGFGIVTGLSELAYDPEVKEKLRIAAEKFTTYAVGVLNECFVINERRTHKLLLQELPDFNKQTVLKLAYDVLNRQFISQKPVQNLLNGIWFGGISFNNSTFKFLISPILPGLFLLRFKDCSNDETHVKRHTIVQEETVPLSEISENNRGSNGKGNPLRSNVSQHEDSLEKSNHCGFFMKVKEFYCAPVMVFAHNMIAYIMFLLMFSYMLLVEFSAKVSNTEIVLYVWVGVLLIEEIRQAVTAKECTGINMTKNRRCLKCCKKIMKPLKCYFENVWNKVDILTIVLFFCAAMLRCNLSYEYLEAARIVYGISLLVFFFRMLRVFSVNQELGPKLTMIQRMMVDLSYFIIILMVFVISYAITAYAILHPNSTFNFELIMRVLKLGYFNIYGELFLDDIEISEPECSFDPLLYNNGTLPKCPERFRQIFTVSLMAVYILISNVLLLNILIAMFGNTFQKVQEKTNQYWYCQRFSLVLEFYQKPFLPAPISAPIYIWLLLRWVYYTCSGCCSNKSYSESAMRIKLRPDVERALSHWETLMADIYVYRIKCQDQNSLENRINNISQRLDSLSYQVKEMDKDKSI